MVVASSKLNPAMAQIEVLPVTLSRRGITSSQIDRDYPETGGERGNINVDNGCMEI